MSVKVGVDSELLGDLDKDRDHLDERSLDLVAELGELDRNGGHCALKVGSDEELGGDTTSRVVKRTENSKGHLDSSDDLNEIALD